MPGTRGREAEVDQHHRQIRAVIGTWVLMGLMGLVGLWLTACVASQATGPVGPRPAYDRLLSVGDIQVAETHLRDFGYNPGPVDGVFTAETQAALRAYQRRYGLPVTGRLDWATRLELVPGLDQPGIIR
jgi:Putative peptidoglycan binding domain